MELEPILLDKAVYSLGNLGYDLRSRILIIEPFYGGSHKHLVDILAANIPGCAVFQLPAKKWHWRSRTSALYFAEIIPRQHSFEVVFASCVLNLAELIALRPDLSNLKKVLYFHENQLVYPVRKQQDRDFQYGYNQLLSCLVADDVVFNSKFNMESFLGSIKTFLKLMPDHRPVGLAEKIRPKCQVICFPVSVDLSEVSVATERNKKSLNGSYDNIHEQSVNRKDSQTNCEENEKKGVSCPLHIVWAHRWEHDKNPELFFQTLYELKHQQIEFYVSVLGESFSEVPEIFSKARSHLADHIISWGYKESRQQYLSVLQSADVAVSTANHEFFGVAMLEAVICGCYPLCPNQLVYPEIFPKEYLYSTPQQLLKRLKQLCRRPCIARRHVVKVDVTPFQWSSLKDSYETLLLSKNLETEDKTNCSKE